MDSELKSVSLGVLFLGLLAMAVLSYVSFTSVPSTKEVKEALDARDQIILSLAKRLDSLEKKKK